MDMAYAFDKSISTRVVAWYGDDMIGILIKPIMIVTFLAGLVAIYFIETWLVSKHNQREKKSSSFILMGKKRRRIKGILRCH